MTEEETKQGGTAQGTMEEWIEATFLFANMFCIDL